MITPEKCIPNCVGRLDPVMDAIKRLEWYEADDLLEEERVRRLSQISRLEQELSRKQIEYAALKKFQRSIVDYPVFRELCYREANR